LLKILPGDFPEWGEPVIWGKAPAHPSLDKFRGARDSIYTIGEHVMKIKIRRLLLLLPVLAPFSLGLSGCYILPEATGRDLKQSTEWCGTLYDSALRDLYNYERADRRADDGWKDNRADGSEGE
jgi:hypothetical protein